MNFCPQCGQPVKAGDKFCNSCGHALVNADTANDTNVNTNSDDTMIATGVDGNATSRTVNHASGYQKQPFIHPLDSYDLHYWDFYKKALIGKYGTFTGRACRREYFAFGIMTIFVNSLIAIVFGLLSILTESSLVSTIASGLMAVWSLGIFLPSLALTVRRLHDTDHSAWWLLINLIPLVGSIVMLVFVCTKGQAGDNQYGPQTGHIPVTEELAKELGVRKSPSTGMTVAFVLGAIIAYVLGFAIQLAGTAASLAQLGGVGQSAVLSGTSKAGAMPATTNVGSNPAKPANLTPNDIAQEESRDALDRYYTLLSSRNYTEAYQYLSDAKKAELGSFDQWRNGYVTTLETNLVELKALSTTPNQVVYEYHLEAEDNINGQVKTQRFAGTVTMVKLNNRWIIQEQDGHLE